MTQEQLKEKEDIIEKLAKEYSMNRTDINKRTQLWEALWKIRGFIFHSKKIRGYLSFSPSSEYATGEEFLTTIFNDSILKILNAYCPDSSTEKEEEHKFIPYFIMKYRNYVLNAVRDIKIQKHKLELIAHTHNVTTYVKKSINDNAKKIIKFIPLDQTLVPEKHYTVLREDYEDSQRWLMVELQSHGKHVYVKEDDIEYLENNIQESLELFEENHGDLEGSDDVDTRINVDITFELYILELLSMIQKLNSKLEISKKDPPTGHLTKHDSYKLFYTEKLIKDVKICYEHANVTISRERDVLSEANREFIDYLLVCQNCRTMCDIAKTSMKKYSDFPLEQRLRTEITELNPYKDVADIQKLQCTIGRLPEMAELELSFPIEKLIYITYLKDIKHLERKYRSIESSLSTYQTEFNNLYKLLCENEFKHKLAEGDYSLPQIK